MRVRSSFSWVVALFTLTSGGFASAVAQAPAGHPSVSQPSTLAAAREWSIAVARRASEILSSPATWDRVDTTGSCPEAAKTFSILCALQRASDEGAKAFRDSAGKPQHDGRLECGLRRVETHEEGSCGAMFDELPVFVIAKVPAVTTGRWRTDVGPKEVWAGTMVDASEPVMQAARQTVDAVSTKKYPARLIGYNNDSATTFADVQRFFQVVEDRLAHANASAFIASGDSVEIEVYAGGTGVVRTFAGWFPVSAFEASNSAVRFAIDTSKQVAPSALDRKIIQRADAILVSDAVWNRADNRRCPAGATTWSIYCALERATIEVTGGFHHRRPALELVRIIVEDRTKGRNYNHRLMDYNNDSTTHLGDVRSLFAEAAARVREAPR